MTSCILSIIIPVYKVEGYIAKCLKSCMSEDILGRDYEIILVDDGTPDRSAEIAEELISGKDGCTLIHKSNGGLSSARNTGLAAARGEYVWFVDSDDTLTEGAVSRVIEALLDKPDLLELQFRMVYEDNRPAVIRREYVWDGEIDGTELMRRGGLSSAAQFTVWRREFLKNNGLRFKEGILHEDLEFKPRAIYPARKCRSLDFVAYDYLQRSSGSITSRYSLRNGMDSIRVMDSLLHFAQAHDSRVVRDYFGRRIGRCLNCVLDGMRSLPSADRQKITRALRERKEIYRAIRKCGNLKYVAEGVLFSANFSTAMILYRLLRR